jgi:hypothetical protein
MLLRSRMPSGALLVILGLTLAACSAKKQSTALPPGLSPHEAVVVPAPAKGELTRAAARGDLAAVRALIARGADLNENAGTDSAPLTPLIAALVSRQESTAQALFQAGASTTLSIRGYDAEDIARAQGFESLAQRMAVEGN